MESRRVLIVDDHPVVRRGLRAMLESEAWVGEVLEAASVAEAIRAAVTGRADLVAMDVTLPDGDGIDAVSRLAQARPEARVVILTMSDDTAVVARALRAGVAGYLLKDTPPEAALHAMHAIACGGFVLGPRVGTALLSQFRAGPPALPAPLDQLNERERVLLTRLAHGDSNARIARHLGLSEKTVRNQLSILFTKLGVADRVQAALLARDAGLAG